MIDHDYYFDTLYPLQDATISVLAGLETEFYLTGGTAASRLYLQHRFSDDLDFFVNDRPEFILWAERLIQALDRQPLWTCQVLNKDERFVRLAVQQSDVLLKLELINDVPAHVGQIQTHPTLGRVDSAENILANKVTAVLGREGNFSIFRGCGRSPDRATGGHGRRPARATPSFGRQFAG
jgi:hypothetical protein